MKKINKIEIEKKLQKELAIGYLQNYCKQNKLSLEKLKNEMFQLSYNQCGFFHPSDVVPDGLVNDVDTLPKTTLVIKYEDGGLVIEQTNYTKEFLSLEWYLALSVGRYSPTGW